MMRALALAAGLLAGVSPAAAGSLPADDIEAIGRTVYAEAGGESDAGKAAVVFTILNRYVSGSYGGTIQAVIEQRHAFEPVTRAGGWRNLPPLRPEQRAKVETILALGLDGALVDVSGGATHFQNEAIVAERARSGTGKPAGVGFGGLPVTRPRGPTYLLRAGGGSRQWTSYRQRGHRLSGGRQ